MSPACELALALVTLCVAPPAAGKPVIVTKSCVFQFTKQERAAAIACARENGVRWRLNRGR